MNMKPKKLISVLLAAALAMGAASGTSLTSFAAGVQGDINGDGALTADDAGILQNWLLAVPDTAVTDWSAGDINADGLLTSADLSLMKQNLAVPAAADTTVYVVTFADGAVTVADDAGNAASPASLRVDGQTVTVTQPGEFTFSGIAENGQIVVDTDKTAFPNGLVTLNFTGLTLSNETAAPLYIAGVGDECVISVKKGTVNTLSDGTAHTDTYTDSDGEVKEINSVIFARDDIKIKGKGTLNVNGNTADGIVCTNDIKLYNGTINVTTVDDGIRGKDSVRIGNASDTAFDNLKVTVNAAGGDGIKSSNSTDETKGYVEINGGTVTVTAQKDGIQAAQKINLNGGEVTVTAFEGVQYNAPNMLAG